MLPRRSSSDDYRSDVADDSVVAIVGEWLCEDDSSWKFVAKRGQMARCVHLGITTGYADLELEIANVFGVDLVSTGIAMTFWYPEETIALTQSKRTYTEMVI